MANIPSYCCTFCGVLKSKEELTVKRIQFVAMGSGAVTERSRVMEWLCNSCKKDDPDWNRKKFSIPRIELTERQISNAS